MARFDPTKYLTKVGRADYLEVRWRLVWLREEHPDAIIDTEQIILTDQLSVFKATIEIPNGGGSATGHGSETPGDFRDYLEKAETKAIGRACAALGYGTQFADDFEPAGEDSQPTSAPSQPTQDAAASGQKARTLYYAAAAEVGIIPAAAVLIALGKYPTMTAIDLIDPYKLAPVGDAIRTWAKGPSAVHPNVAWANHIAAADTVDQMTSIGTAMAQAEVKNGLLRGAWKYKKDQLSAGVASAETAV